MAVVGFGLAPIASAFPIKLGKTKLLRIIEVIITTAIATLTPIHIVSLFLVARRRSSSRRRSSRCAWRCARRVVCCFLLIYGNNHFLMIYCEAETFFFLR